VQHADHVALLRAGVPEPGGLWADFGSGHGAFTLALADLIGPGSTLYSIDRDAGALREQARQMAAAFPAVELHTLTADFTRPLAGLPALDGLVMANALHFVADRDKPRVVRLIRSYLKPGGRWLMVEYNVNRGNLWVPHPLTYDTWVALAAECGFARTRLLATRPSSFLKEFFAAESS
jgi:SAM-dependent methyltransferase